MRSGFPSSAATIRQGAGAVASSGGGAHSRRIYEWIERSEGEPETLGSGTGLVAPGAPDGGEQEAEEGLLNEKTTASSSTKS